MKKFFAWWVVTTVLVSAMCVALYWVEYFTADVVTTVFVESPIKKDHKFSGEPTTPEIVGRLKEWEAEVLAKYNLHRTQFAYEDPVGGVETSKPYFEPPFSKAGLDKSLIRSKSIEDMTNKELTARLEETTARLEYLRGNRREYEREYIEGSELLNYAAEANVVQVKRTSAFTGEGFVGPLGTHPASAEFFFLFSFYWLLMYPGLVAIYWAFRFVFRKEEIER